MTAPFEAQIEAEQVEASHLLRARCAACGSATLCAPGREHSARCATCWGGSVIVPAGSLPYTTPVGFPLLRRLGGEMAERIKAFPLPEVSSREEREPDPLYPRPVWDLARAASACGWRVRMQWARGCLPHAATGVPGASQDSYAVRFSREHESGDSYSAFAVRRGSGWPFVWMWGRTLLPFGLGNVTDLKAWLTLGGTAEPAFFDGIRERLAGQAAREAQRKHCDAGRHAALVDDKCTACGNGAGWKKTKKGTGEGL